MWGGKGLDCSGEHFGGGIGGVGEGGALEQGAEAALGGIATVGGRVGGEVGGAAEEADQVDHVAIGNSFRWTAGVAVMSGFEQLAGVGVVRLAPHPSRNAVGTFDEMAHFME